MTSLCGFENLMLPDTTLYAGNEPLKTTDVEHDEDPCSGAVFAEIPIASMADVDAVVDEALRHRSRKRARRIGAVLGT